MAHLIRGSGSYDYSRIWGFYQNEDTHTSLIEEAAKLGITEAQDCLGKLYLKNNDLIQAEKWYLEAASLGDVSAMYHLGSLYYRKKDFDKCFSWFEKASQFNHALAIDQLGVCYSSGDGCTKNIKKSNELFIKAFKEGYEESLCNYYYNCMTPFRINESVFDVLNDSKLKTKLLCKLTYNILYDHFIKKKLNPNLAYKLLMVIDNEEFIKEHRNNFKDLYQDFIEWLNNGISRNDIDMMYKKASLIIKGYFGNEDEAIILYKKAMALGHSDSMVAYGLYLKNYINYMIERKQFYKEKLDPKYELLKAEAKFCFELASYHNHPIGLLELGKCYYEAYGCKLDRGKSLEYFRKAQELENQEAYYYLADNLQLFNWKKEENIQKEIIDLYTKSSSYNKNSQYKLGLCYLNGDGVEQNHDLTIQYLKKSLENGCLEAIIPLTDLNVVLKIERNEDILN